MRGAPVKAAHLYLSGHQCSSVFIRGFKTELRVQRGAQVQHVLVNVELGMVMRVGAVFVRIASAEIDEHTGELLAVVRKVLGPAARLQHFDVLGVEPDVASRQQCPLRGLLVRITYLIVMIAFP